MKATLLHFTLPGWIILAAVFVLCGLGILCLWAAEGQPGVPSDAATKQLAYIGVSLVGAAVVLKVGYLRLHRLAPELFVVTLVLLVFMVAARLLGSLPLIRPINQTYRWIRFPGFSFQPSELMKLVFVIALAWFMTQRWEGRRWRDLIAPLVLAALPMVLILLQPDLGTVMLLCSVLAVMVFLSGIRLRQVVMLGIAGLLAIPAGWGLMADYQRERISGLLLQNAAIRQRVIAQPEKWSWLCSAQTARAWKSGPGYQLIHSKRALGSGGILGQGWGRGVYVRHALLPHKHNDFIFSIIGQQWGLVGCLLVLVCFLAIVLCGTRVAIEAPDPFGRLVSIGIVAMLGTQFLINVGTALVLTPAKGMTLPFVSYGGSSLLTSFLSVGVLISVAQRRRYTLAARKPRTS